LFFQFFFFKAMEIEIKCRTKQREGYTKDARPVADVPSCYASFSLLFES